MTAIVVAIFQMIACYGFGAVGLRILRVGAAAPERERILYAFALGMGTIGWVVFFVGIGGYLNFLTLSVLLGSGVAAAAVLRPDLSFSSVRSAGGLTALLLALLVIVALLDLLEAVTPPGDTDTLAYHFTLPKHFLEAGKIEFVPRALDGATALLVQMTYVPAFGLGEETALMLWVYLSGWMAVFAVYVLARRHLNENWALVLALVFATTPAIVYGAGSGQVESRIIIFVIASILALARVPCSKDISYILLAGLLAGFFVGSKYLGFIFVAVSGLYVLWRRRRIADGFVFGMGVLFAGFQWYAWNAGHIGDPLFPMLFEWLGDSETTIWSSEHQSQLRSAFLPDYQSVPTSLFWLLAFPFKATLNGELAFESGRTGLGPIILVFLAFSIGGFWKFRDRVLGNPLFVYILIAVGFYAIWFFGGLPQRVRFLLPIYPLLLTPVAVAAYHFAKSTLSVKPLVTAISLVLLIQIGGHALYTLKSAKFVFSQETRQAFLLRTISKFEPVPWINDNLPKDAKIFLQDRHYLYYMNVPYYYAHPNLQAQVNLLPNSSDPMTFLGQLRNQKITHLLLSVVDKGPLTGVWKYSAGLIAMKCLKPMKIFSANTIRSRTLSSLKAPSSKIGLYQITSDRCN